MDKLLGDNKPLSIAIIALVVLSSSGGGTLGQFLARPDAELIDKIVKLEVQQRELSAEVGQLKVEVRRLASECPLSYSPPPGPSRGDAAASP